MGRSLTKPYNRRTEVLTGWVVGRLMRQNFGQPEALREGGFRLTADGLLGLAECLIEGETRADGRGPTTTL